MRKIMTKVISWDGNTAKKELSKRLREATEYRDNFTYYWEKNEQLMFDSEGSNQSVNQSSSPEFGTYIENSGLDSAQVTQNSAYAFKNLHYIHSQMSANPPSVLAEPTTSDPDDRLSAMAADRLVSHGRTTYNLTDKVDLLSLNTLTYGTGYLKQVWDSGLGEIIDVDDGGNLTLEGDINIKIPSVWDIFLDQHAESYEEVRYIFQRMFIPLDTALANGNRTRTDSSSMDLDKPGQDVEVYEYWEKGLAENGYDGRYALHLRDGTILGKITPNPHRFLAAETVRKITKKYSELGEDELKARLEMVPQRAELPYHILTHIDVPQSVYGKSVLDYVGPIQENLNRLMLTCLDNAAAHGAVSLVLRDGDEIADDSITNTPFNIIKVAGSAGPYNLQMPSLLGDMGPLMDREKQQIDDIMGVNDAMFGTMKRETANSALQSAAAQGSLIRRRLFNKYTKCVENVYKQFLKLTRKHIDVERLYHIIGKEHPLEALEVKTMDLDGGYDLKVTYGASFSLDPITRRGEIMQYMPLFEKAGVPNSVILEMFQLTELRGMYDRVKVAKERQLEIFDEMIESGMYTPPAENQDHVGMLAAGLEYVMTREFFDLDPEVQMLLNQHLADRKQLGAEVSTQPCINEGLFRFYCLRINGSARLHSKRLYTIT
jgi:hypothetical protein